MTRTHLRGRDDGDVRGRRGGNLRGQPGRQACCTHVSWHEEGGPISVHGHGLDDARAALGQLVQLGHPPAGGEGRGAHRKWVRGGGAEGGGINHDQHPCCVLRCVPHLSVPHCTAHINISLYRTSQYPTIPHISASHSTPLHRTYQHLTVPHLSVPHISASHCTTPLSTPLYCSYQHLTVPHISVHLCTTPVT